MDEEVTTTMKARASSMTSGHGPGPRPSTAPSWTTFVIALLGLVASAAACRERTDMSYGYVYVDSGGGGKLQINGVVFEIDSSVHFVYSSVSTSPGGTTTRATVDGHDFGLRDGHVFVGEKDYGAASAGTTVRITSAGVTVGGELRGPLPPARDE